MGLLSLTHSACLHGCTVQYSVAMMVFTGAQEHEREGSADIVKGGESLAKHLTLNSLKYYLKAVPS